MSTDNDPRRHRVIEVRFRGSPSTYRLTIDGQLWSEVEWSASRRAWCIQDAAGHCLAHIEHIHAQDVDSEAAVRLAKRMIRDGRMPAGRSGPTTARAVRPRSPRRAASARHHEVAGTPISP